ncbi:MAG TPA: glycosyltransferase family 4 protein [Candidatus Saccharimonadales bacterium]
MKIGIVCPYNLFRHGGVQETVFAHQRVLRARGHQVKIISPRPLSFEGKPPRDVILVGLSTDLNYPFKTKADVSIKIGLAELKTLLDNEHFDILHFHEPWVPLFPRQLLNMSSSINVGTFHAKWPERLIYRTFGKAIRPYARSIANDLDYIVAASVPASYYINELLETSVPVIYNGIDLKLYNPTKVRPLKKYADDRKLILYINRLEKRKGPDLLLKAYRELVRTEPDVRLVIASDGDMRDKLEAYALKYQLPGVEFLGFVSQATKIRLYKSADVYCAPSPYGEGFGIVLLEAMAMQVPYVAGDNVGYRLASGARANNYLVDPTDTKKFARQLKTMLTDQTARASYKKWSRAQAAKHDYESIVSQYEQVYKALVNEHAKKT